MSFDARPVVAVFRSTAFNASEGFIQTQAAGLSRYQPLVVAFRRTSALRPELAPRLLTPWAAGEAAAMRLFGRCLPPACLRLAAPAVVHAHFATDGLIALPLAKALGIPLITSLRGYDVTVRPARMLASGRLSWMRYVLAGRRLKLQGELFLAVSDALRRKALEQGFPPDRTLTHYNGVDLARFQPSPGRAEPGLVLHVGRLVEKKGTAVLLRAFAQACAGRPSARLAIIGDGPLRPGLERLTAELGLADCVRFLGSLPQTEVADWMARAWLICQPSVTGGNGDAEGLPNVLVEAAASATPAVATLHSGIPEAVADGASGFLVPERDAQALAGRLSALLDAGELRGRMALAARALAEERFCARCQAVRLEAHYDRARGL